MINSTILFYFSNHPFKMIYFLAQILSSIITIYKTYPDFLRFMVLQIKIFPEPAWFLLSKMEHLLFFSLC